MKKILKFSCFIITVLALSITSCKNVNNQNKDENDTDSTLSRVEDIKKSYFKIPFPSELFWLIKDFGATYSRNILNPTNNIKKYTTSNP